MLVKRSIYLYYVKTLSFTPIRFIRPGGEGADAVLLIAAVLSDRDLQYFLKISKLLGIAALVEVHTAEELDRVLALEGIQLIGINNRNLEDFSVSLQTTTDLLASRQQQIQDKGVVIVSESGIFERADLDRVANAGASAVLVGESLMRQPDPGAAIARLFAS